MLGVDFLSELKGLGAARGFDPDKMEPHAKTLCYLYSNTEVLIAAKQKSVAYRSVSGEFNQIGN